MKFIHNYKMPLGFKIKPVVLKPKRAPSTSKKRLTGLLYAIAKKENDVWKAYINTRGLEGFESVTVLQFTENSFNLKGRWNVFLHHKDETNHWVRIIRTRNEAELNPGSSDVFCTLCHGDCFTGYIVKDNESMLFDMHTYKGMSNEYIIQLTKTNNKNNECD